MIEMRWVGRELQFRERDHNSPNAFGPWKTVQQRRGMPKFVKAARKVVDAFEQHGIGPEFPELQTAIEGMQQAFDKSIWDRFGKADEAIDDDLGFEDEFGT